MKKIRVGVVGVGAWGRNHARCYANQPDAELVWVVDIDPDRAAGAAREHKTQPKTDYRVDPGSVDAVSVTVPTAAHYEIAKYFLEHGVNVLVEKPITNSLAQAKDLIRLAQKSGTILQVGHLERFNPAVEVLLERVSKPCYIEAHRLSPFPGRSTDVDVILDMMIHDLDIILTLANSPVEDVRAIGTRVISSHTDIANVRLEFVSGCVANINASRISPERMRKLRLFQQDAYLSLNFIKQELYCLQLSSSPAPVFQPNRRMESLFSQQQIEIEKKEPLAAELKTFLQVVRKNTPPPISGEDGLKALDLALRIRDQIQVAQKKFNQNL